MIRSQIINSLTGRMMSVIILFFFFVHTGNAQEENYDSLLDATLKEDSLLLSELLSEESSIMDLIDSLIMLTEPRSSMSVRLSYTSNVAYAGRNFGINQYGFSAGMAYYHKNGLFTDLSGYWNSNAIPKYNPTVLSAGYLGTIGKKISYIASFDHYFYQYEDNDEFSYTYPLTNSISLAGYYDFEFFSAGIDYSFLFGEETANRIRGNIIGKIRFKNPWFLDRISISPGASILFGNQNIYSISQSYQVEREAFWEELIGKYGLRYLLRLRRNNREEYRNLLRENFPDYIYISTEESSENVFGLMNYSFSLPVYFTKKQFTLALSYHLNIPVSLPGEDIEYDPNSYFSVSLLYNLIFK